MTEIRFLSEATVEYEVAINFYRESRTGIDVDFQDHFERALQIIKDHPQSGSPRRNSNKRLMFVGKYPYQIVYRIDGETILIIAIAHTSRRPGYWRKRI